MKIPFVRPGDKFILNEDGSVENTVNGILEKSDEMHHHRTNWSEYWTPIEYHAFIKTKNHFVPEGTELIVNQIYIRKNGWFDDSITFRVPKNMIVGTKRIIRIKLIDVENWDVDLVRGNK